MAPSAQPRPVRVLRVIARMNIGGPAHHVSLLSGGLDRRGYETLLVVGRPAAHEGSMQELAAQRGATTVELPWLGPEVHPVRDARALGALTRIVRRFGPDIVHTHTAKAGFLARTAALATAVGRRPPIIVHTFHGHVLEGYFGPAKTAAYRGLERGLARRSDRLIAVSDATRDDLVRLGVAPAHRLSVIPLGLELDGLRAADTDHDGAAVRRELGVADADLVLGCIGRLVPIKRIDVLLRALAVARGTGSDVRVLLAGDGSHREPLERLAHDLGLDGAVRFLGYRRDVGRLLTAVDAVVLSSDNEGTPVSIIEAAAAGRAAISTDVGGVAAVVAPGTGVLVPAGDHQRLGRAMAEAGGRPEELRAMGRRAKALSHRFDAARLLDDVDGLYRELLTQRRG